MAFIGNEDHLITLEEGETLIKNFQNKEPEDAVKAHFFGKDFLRQVLDQEGCVGIRVYYAREEDGTPTVVLLGANANEGDMTGGYIGNKSKPCPPHCGSLGFLKED